MRPVLKSCHSPDVFGLLDSFVPDDPNHFGLLLEVEIGIRDEDGADLFSLTVCSPSWLADHALPGDPDGHRLLRHHLVLGTWHLDTVMRVLDDLCRDAEADTWPESTTRLSRYLAWEYEDYVPAS